MSTQKKEGNWHVLDTEDFVIVIPFSDIRPHGFPKEGEKSAELAWSECPCKPKVTYDGKKQMIVHNSFEEMKAVEEALSKITK